MAERHAFGIAAIGATMLWGGVAWAQNTQRQVPESEIAEQRAHGGDCAGALDAFDRAIARTIDPDLRRDRGACHDKLGHPFPAIDDYRAYLTARPNAPDADQIRERLQALEAQVGILKEGQAAAKTSGGSSADVSVSFGAGSGKGAAGKNLEELEHDEQLDNQADASPLRRGKGLMFGLVFDPVNYGKEGIGWAEIAGIDFRYSFSPMSTILAEFNFDHINGSGTATAIGGPGLELGYEARFALNPRVNDAIIAAAKIGYEHLAQGSTGIVFAAIQPRGRIGYRHVFGPSFGLEGSIDGGVAILQPTGIAGASSTTSSMIGAHLGLVIGF